MYYEKTVVMCELYFWALVAVRTWLLYVYAFPVLVSESK
jgi:hypothetical protein